MASPNVPLCTRVEQCAVITFLTFEKVSPIEMYLCLKVLYGSECVDRSTVNKWTIKLCDSKDPNAQICDNPRSGRSITASDDLHRARVDDLFQGNRRIIQQTIANHLGICKERVGFIIKQLNYRKICSRWLPQILKPGLHLLSFTENRRERIFAANIDEKPLIWFTLASIRQENVKKM